MRTKTLETYFILREDTARAAGFSFHYYLLEEKNTIDLKRPSKYSIKIEMRDPAGCETFAITEKYCYDGGRALSFYNLLVKNLATPCNLPYLCDDFEF